MILRLRRLHRWIVAGLFVVLALAATLAVTRWPADPALDRLPPALLERR